MIWNENTLFIWRCEDETKDPQDGMHFIDPNNAKTPYLQDDDVWAIIRTDWTAETNKPDEIEIIILSALDIKNIILNAHYSPSKI